MIIEVEAPLMSQLRPFPSLFSFVGFEYLSAQSCVDCIRLLGEKGNDLTTP